MSWSKSYESYELFKADKLSVFHEQQEVQDQMKVARKAVEDIVESGAVGKVSDWDKEKKDFSIVIGGHANPDHTPVSGWSNDSISISIYQR